MDKSQSINYVIWTVIVVSFRSLLRKSNLVPSDYKGFKHVLCRRDVTFHDWGLLLSVRSTKTLQHKQYVLETPLYYVNDQVLCGASLQ